VNRLFEFVYETLSDWVQAMPDLLHAIVFDTYIPHVVGLAFVVGVLLNAALNATKEDKKDGKDAP